MPVATLMGCVLSLTLGANLVFAASRHWGSWNTTANCCTSTSCFDNDGYFAYGFLPTVPPANASAFVSMDVANLGWTTVTFTSTQNNFYTNTPSITWTLERTCHKFDFGSTPSNCPHGASVLFH